MQMLIWFVAYLLLILALATWREHHDALRKGAGGGRQSAVRAPRWQWGASHVRSVAKGWHRSR